MHETFQTLTLLIESDVLAGHALLPLIFAVSLLRHDLPAYYQHSCNITDEIRVKDRLRQRSKHLRGPRKQLPHILLLQKTQIIETSDQCCINGTERATC